MPVCVGCKKDCYGFGSTEKGPNKTCNRCLGRYKIYRDKNKPKIAARFRKRRLKPEIRAREKELQRGYRLRDKYGLTPTVVEVLTEAQEGKCAICQTVPPRLVIDHNHKTNKVRNLLCDHCNHGIGSFFEDPARMKRAIDYLNYWNNWT